MHRPKPFGPPPTTLNIQQITFTYTYPETNWIQPLRLHQKLPTAYNSYNLGNVVWDAEFHIKFKRDGMRIV